MSAPNQPPTRWQRRRARLCSAPDRDPHTFLRPRVTQLQKTVGTAQLFTLAFGAAVGVGWIVVMGEWLDLAGPLGAITAFAAGAAVHLAVGLCYAEVASRLPIAGGEFVYTYANFGERAAFAIGWMLVLGYVGILTFEAVSVGWVLRSLFPGIEGPVAYRLFGEAVHVGSLIAGLLGMLGLAWFSYRGARAATLLQDVLVYTFLLVVALFIGAGLFTGDGANLEPLFRGTGAIRWSGVLAVFATTPMWYAGFVVIPQMMEERAARSSPRSIALGIALSIGISGLFYCGVILAASMVQPWQEILALELPVAATFERAFGSPLLGKIVLFCGLIGLITTWNTFLLGAARVLFALGRAQLIAPRLGQVHPRNRSPANAVIFCALLGSLGTFLGRPAIGFAINLFVTVGSLAFFATCVGLLRLRAQSRNEAAPYRAPGGRFTPLLGILASLGIFALSLQQPYVRANGGIPPEWFILAGWILLGAGVWRVAHGRRQQISPSDRRALILGDTEI